MGLGKTLSAIALILTHPNPNPPSSSLFHSPYQYWTNATLVVCPSHLVQQWRSELTKFCLSPNLNAYIVTTKDQWSCLTYQTVIDADVVIVSAQFFQNPNYLK